MSPAGKSFRFVLLMRAVCLSSSLETKNRYGRVYFVCGLKRYPDKFYFFRSKFENVWLSHIKWKVFCFWQRFIRFPGGSICWLPIDVLQSYREQIHEKLKCMAQPYKMEVLTEVGWILCWRDRELWLFYRQLRWRMVKMVRNAYEMAIPEKNCRFFFEKNR